MEQNAKYLFCQKDCCKIFDILPQNFGRLGVECKKEIGKEKFYDIREVGVAVRQKTTAYNKSAINLTVERAKLAKAQTTKTKIDSGKSKLECQVKEIEVEERRLALEQLKGNVVKVSDVENTWVMLGLAFKAKVLSIPLKCGSVVLSMSSAAEAEACIRKAVLEALEELAKSPVKIEVEGNVSVDNIGSSRAAENQGAGQPASKATTTT